MDDTIIQFPEYEELHRSVEKLRVELSMLVSEKDELRYIICKNIETQYLLLFGALEYEVYEAECTYRRLKRKLDLIQAKINRQEEIYVKQIEKALNEEFAEYQRVLDEKIRSMNEALRRKQSEALSEKDNKEFKALYHRIVKALHPDLHPELSDSRKELFNNAVEAYKNGDLDALRVIDAITADNTADALEEDSVTRLHKEKDRLMQLVQAVKDTILKIKNVYPYTAKERIENKDKADTYLKELNEILVSYREACTNLNQKIQDILG